MASTKLFLTYNELLEPLGKMLEFAKYILEGVVLDGSWSIKWRMLIKLTPLNWSWWMIISFVASVTGINTLLSKKFHGKSMIGVLKDQSFTMRYVMWTRFRNDGNVPTQYAAFAAIGKGFANSYRLRQVTNEGCVDVCRVHPHWFRGVKAFRPCRPAAIKSWVNRLALAAMRLGSKL